MEVSGCRLTLEGFIAITVVGVLSSLLHLGEVV